MPKTYKEKFTGPGFLIIAILIISTTLRAPITAIGPLAEMIHNDLNVSNSFVGVITTLPLLAFALSSSFIPRISSKLGIGTTMFMGLVFIIAGGLLRSYTGTLGLLLGTAIIGVGISTGNVLIPSVLRMKFPDKIGVLTSSYATCMSISASLAAGVSYPLAVNMGLGWKNSLMVWSLIALVAIISWLPHMKLNTRLPDSHNKDVEKKRKHKNVWKSQVAWFLTVTFGLQSFIFYSMGAWLPSIMVAKGFSPETSGYMALWYQLAAIPAALLVPILAARLNNHRVIILGGCSLYIIGFAILFTANPFLLILISLALVALGGGSCFSWSLAMFSILGDGPEESAAVSGMAQSVGYLLAAMGPTLCGAIFDRTNSWTIVIGLFFLMTLTVFLLGMKMTQKDKLFI